MMLKLLTLFSIVVVVCRSAVSFVSEVYVGDNTCSNKPVASVVVNFAGIMGDNSNFSNTSNGVVFKSENDGCWEVQGGVPFSFKFDCNENGTFDYYWYDSASNCTGQRIGFLNQMNLSAGCMPLGAQVASNFKCSATISSEYAHIAVFAPGTGTCSTNNVMAKIVDVYGLLNYCLKLKDMPFNDTEISGSMMLNSVSGSNFVMTTYKDDFCQEYVHQDAFSSVGCLISNRREDAASPVQFAGFGDADASSTSTTGVPTGNAPNPFPGDDSGHSIIGSYMLCLFYVFILFL